MRAIRHKELSIGANAATATTTNHRAAVNMMVQRWERHISGDPQVKTCEQVAGQ